MSKQKQITKKEALKLSMSLIMAQFLAEECAIDPDKVSELVKKWFEKLAEKL